MLLKHVNKQKSCYLRFRKKQMVESAIKFGQLSQCGEIFRILWHFDDLTS